MEFYTLNPLTYDREVLIEEFESAIWTERFIEAGDTRLVVPATKKLVQLLAPGTLLSLKDSKEVMVLDTREIENGTVTVTGKTIEAFFNERSIPEMNITETPRNIMMEIIAEMQSRSITYQGSGFTQQFGYIPGLTTQSFVEDPNVTPITKKLVAGPAYSALLELAQKYRVGMYVQRTTSGSGTHQLVFSTYIGKDLSSVEDQSEFIRYYANEMGSLVRFSPNLDNLANVKELLSEVDFKNFVVIQPPTQSTPQIVNPMFRHNSNYGYLDLGASPFSKRYVEAGSDDLLDEVNDPVEFPSGWHTLLYNKMDDRAYVLMDQNLKTMIIDGEVTPDAVYKYGDHYRLGDLVEMEGYFGNQLKGTVSEYVRSQDGTGERAYPAVSVTTESGELAGAG